MDTKKMEYSRIPVLIALFPSMFNFKTFHFERISEQPNIPLPVILHCFTHIYLQNVSQIWYCVRKIFPLITLWNDTDLVSLS